MRKRSHEIKIRLNDKEFAHVNDMAARYVSSREAMIRDILAGYELVEKPSVDEWAINMQLSKIGTELNMAVSPINHQISEMTRAKLEALQKDIWFLSYLVVNAYMPMTKYRRDMSAEIQAFLDRHKEDGEV